MNITPLYRTRETKYKSLETFIENMEKELFNCSTVQNVKIVSSNLGKDVKKALKEIKSWGDKVVRIKNKGSRFVILENEVHKEKVQQQIDRSSSLEKVFYKEVERISSRIEDTSYMFHIIDNLNDFALPENSVLVSFDVVNMFPSIDNKSGVTTVEKVLNDRESKNHPTECVLKALRRCLECSNSAFHDKNFV